MLQKLLHNLCGKLLLVMHFLHARVPFHDNLSLFCCNAPIYGPTYESEIQGTSKCTDHCRTAALSANCGPMRPTPIATTCCGWTPTAAIGGSPARSAMSLLPGTPRPPARLAS